MSKSPFGNIKVVLDTNVLCYLLDNTYPNLNKFIEALNESDFVELFCSQFVIYELIEVRKLEHYLRKIHKKTTSEGGQMNFSAVLKYRKNWSAAELDYGDIYTDIMALVESDIQKIHDDFGIEFGDVTIHENLWKPLQKLVLSSKISKEDSLVLLSSVYPNIDVMHDYVVFLTNDHPFYDAYEKDKIGKLDKVFESHDIKKPILLKIDNIKLPRSNTQLNLIKDNKTDDDIQEYVSCFILEHFKIKNENFFLGEIIPCACKNKKDMFCFHLEKDELNKGIYVSILTKELSVFNLPRIDAHFWAYGEIKDYPYRPDETEESRKMSVKLLDKEGHSLIEEKQLKEIMQKGNLVFIHPDNS